MRSPTQRKRCWGSSGFVALIYPTQRTCPWLRSRVHEILCVCGEKREENRTRIEEKMKRERGREARDKRREGSEEARSSLGSTSAILLYTVNSILAI